MSTRDFWQKPELFEIYDRGRLMTGGVLDSQISEIINPYLEPDDVVVELGAGGGALRRMLGNIATENVMWIETDQTQGFLALRRQFPTLKLAAELPNVPLQDESADLIVGLSMLDTLYPEQLDGTFREIRRVLKPGKSFLHILDLTPNYNHLIDTAKEHGQSIYMFANNEDDCTGAYVVNSKQLRKRIINSTLPKSVKNVLMEYENDPISVLEIGSSTHPQLADYLASVVASLGLKMTVIKDLWEYFDQNISQSAEENGVSLEMVEYLTKRNLVPRNLIPPSGSSIGSVRRHKGILDLSTQSKSGLYIANSVEVSSTVLVHRFTNNSSP